MATTAASGITTSSSGWTATMQSLTATNKYLWNYEVITYTDNTTATISPVIIGVYGDKGNQGIGINSVTVTYGTSTSASTQPTSWQATIPTVAEGSYLWTRTVTDYTDSSVADTVTYTYAKQGEQGGIGPQGTSVAVSSIQYQASTSATTAPTGTWSNSVVSVAEGSYLWTKTTFSDGKVAYGVAKSGSSASLVSITPSSHYFKSTTGKDGTFTPDYIYLYPRFQTVTFSKWQYSVNGGTTWVDASGANGLSISTYNSVANTLRIAKTSTLYTDSATSISFRCVSSNSAIYDTVSIAKIYDVVDLQIGGRNLVLASNVKYSTTTEYRVASYNMSEDWELNTQYTLTIKGDINDGQTFGAWAYGSGTRVATLSYDSENGVYKSIFTTPSSIASQTPKVINIYNTPSATAASASIEWIKLERGNKATDWSPAPEDLKSITFQLYAPKGYLITNDVPEVTLQTFAYDGSNLITNATFKWYSWSGENWTEVNNSTGTSLVVNKNQVLKSCVYKCEMAYNNDVYEATATVEDKTDIYDSLIRVTAKRTSNNSIYWILYATVYSEEGERDTLLGPVSETAPTSPTTGAYWYQIDPSNYSITLKKYSGTAWVTSTDKQELLYDWLLFKDAINMVSLGDKSKVKIVKSGDFVTTCNVQCNIFDAENNVLSRNNQVLNDPTDPIVSDTAPVNPIDGQIWIQIGANNSYTLSVWNTELNQWVLSSADTQHKVYVTKPSQYNSGDLWIVDSNYLPTAYENGVMKDYKHPEKTMLKAIATSQTYSDAHWTEALKYQKELDGVIGDMEKFKQFISIDDTGLTMQAKGSNNTISDFKTMLTNTELGFYQGSTRVAYINNNQLNISKAEITNGLTVSGTTPTFKIGNFTFIQESNGSLSIG